VRLSDLDDLVTRSRLRSYALLLAAGYVLCVIYTLVTLKHGVDPWGRAPGSDFITFYAASDLARHGQAVAAFDMARIAAVEQTIAPVDGIYAWHYPPPFQLLIAPLAFVPYSVALAAWTAMGLGLLLAVTRRVSDHPLAMLAVLGFPAVFINTMHGQNGALNTAVLGFGLLALDRRPWLAGLALGLLVYKPHFGVLLPLLLAAQGRWKSFAAAGISASLFCGAAYLAYGSQPWLAFLHDLSSASALVADGQLPWAKMPSLFVAATWLGAPAPVAYALQGAVAVILAALTVQAWRRPGPQVLKVALAVPAIVAVSPYCFDYDLVLLALPIGLIAEYGRRHVLPTGVRASLALGYFTPIAFTALAGFTHVQLMPLGILALYAAAWRTLAAARETTSSAIVPAPGLAVGGV
jgi:alpha-1,2-mannosyltransferase